MATAQETVTYQECQNQEQNGAGGPLILRAINDWASMPKEFKKPMPKSIFKREFDKFLNNSF